MLDAAHSVFNPVTGVSTQDEANEIQAFRPLSEWRSMMEKLRFVDAMQYGLERGDCTYDFMLCFSKGKIQPRSVPKSPLLETLPESLEPPVMSTIRVLLAQLPSSVAGWFHLLSLLLERLPLIKENFCQFLLEVLPDALEVERRRKSELSMLQPESFLLLSKLLAAKLEKLIAIGSAAQNLLHDINIRESADFAGLLSTPEALADLAFAQTKAEHSAGKYRGVGESRCGVCQKITVVWIKEHQGLLRKRVTIGPTHLSVEGDR